MKQYLKSNKAKREYTIAVIDNEFRRFKYINDILQQAKKVIEEYPDQNEYVNQHYIFGAVNGEYDDNSIECATYWQSCKDLVNTVNNKKDIDKNLIFFISEESKKIELHKMIFARKKEINQKINKETIDDLPF